MDDEELLGKLAKDYSKTYGRELLKENETLAQADQYDTRGLQRKVRAWQQGTGRRHLFLRIGAAACAALLVVVMRLTGPSSKGPDSTLTPSESPAPIALSAPLPQGFTQQGFEQDQGQSIYYLEQQALDHVVMTLEHGDLLSDTRGLIPVKLGDATVYGAQTDSYNLLTFAKDGVVYTLTCRYDINTLTALAEAII